MRTKAGPYSIGSDLWPGLSKLIEEAGEVVQVVGKLIATGGNRKHWDGPDLFERLADELGDLQAAVDFVIVMHPFLSSRIALRREEKLRLFERWHREQNVTGGGPD